MRCSRCDRPVVPQALGLTPDGHVVFGWCLACLREAGCARIEPVLPRRERSTRLLLEERPRGSRLGGGPDDSSGASGLREPLVKATAGFLALWGLVLFTAGLVSLTRKPTVPPSPLGNGTATLLIGGGGSTALAALALWALSARSSPLRSPRLLRTAQAGGFGLALLVLGLGVAWHDPRRDPWVVAAASLALATSATARWVERRSRRLPARSVRGRDRAAPGSHHESV